MSLIRWSPMRDMVTVRDMMDRFFDEAYGHEMGMDTLGAPAIDMYQTDDDVVVKAVLPGMKPEDIQVSVTGDVLTLRGEFKQEQEQGNKNTNYHIRERRYGTFSRSIALPAPVKTDSAKAEFEDGILTLTLPKSEEVKPKTINIKPNK